MFADLLFLIIVVGVIFYKLFKVLGQSDRIESCHKVFDPIIEELRGEKKQEVDINIISATEAALPQHIRDILDKIRLLEKDFNADIFLVGAKKAFSMVISAFAAGDKEKLRYLVDEEVLKNFVRTIDKHLASGHIYEKIVVGIKEIEILNVSLSGSVATIEVRILSEQINYMRDKGGNLLDGSKERITVVEDHWTFSKQMGGANIWKLVAVSKQ